MRHDIEFTGTCHYTMMIIHRLIRPEENAVNKLDLSKISRE